MMLCKMSQNRKSAISKTFSVFIIEAKWHWSNDNDVQEKNWDIARKILSLIFSDKHQWHCKLIYTLDSIIWLMHFRRWSETNNQKSKSRQSIRHFRHFEQSAADRSCRTDFDTDEFIQCMCNIWISFEAVQKSSNDSTMQIKEEQLYWFKNILIHCFAWYHEQSSEVNHD